MNIFLCFETAFRVIVDKLAAENLLPKDLDTSRVVFELPREASHGDIEDRAGELEIFPVG